LLAVACASSLLALLVVGCSAAPGDPGYPGDPSGTPPATGGGGEGGGQGTTGNPGGGGGGGAGVSGGGEDAGAHPDASKEDGGSPPHDSGPPNPCPALTYPSGVVIQSFENAAMTASYADHLAAGESAPKCFLDTDNLVDPTSGQVHDLSVNVAAHFQLVELVGTEVNGGYGHIVLAEPKAVESLEKFRETLNTPVSVISGFRSPKHQEDVCNSLCGNPLGCPGTCANNSRHMFGDAFDLPLEFYTTPDEEVACNVGFKFAFLESGTHLHVDQNPAYSSCVIE
jgi:peptidase M15-like protein